MSRVGMRKMDSDIKRFGPFEVDLARHELRKNGVRLRLHDQAFTVLTMLVENRGEIVTREEIIKTLWAGDVFVDFDQGVGAAINKLRRALGDSASTPRYVETIRNRGFRLLLPVLDGMAASVNNAAHATAADVAVPVTPAGANTSRLQKTIAAALFLGLITALGGVWLAVSRAKPTSTQQVRSIAVLPFRVFLPPNEQVPYAGLGMSDALITSLSHLRQITVRPTSAIRKYAGIDTHAVDAGRELRVDAVVEGTMQENGSNTRVRVQLVLIPDGRTAWADTFDEPSSGLANLQDRISERIASSLAVELTPSERQRLTKRYTSNAQAFQAYQKGRYLWGQRTKDALERSIPFLQQAVALDPGYALAHAGLADCYALAYLYNPRQRRDWAMRAKAAVREALRLDPDLAQAHAILAGLTFQYDWDATAAEASFRHAIQLNPNYASAHQWYAELLFYTERFDEAAVEIRKALELDPQSTLINLQLASPILYSRHWKEAIAVASESRRLDPAFPLTSYVIGTAYTELRQYEAAYAEFGRIADSAMGMTGLGYARARAGDIGGAGSALNKLITMQGLDEASPYQVAAVLANIPGRADEAIAWLRLAKRERDERMVVLRVDPKFDPLRKHPRFPEMLP